MPAWPGGGRIPRVRRKPVEFPFLQLEECKATGEGKRFGAKLGMVWVPLGIRAACLLHWEDPERAGGTSGSPQVSTHLGPRETSGAKGPRYLPSGGSSALRGPLCSLLSLPLFSGRPALQGLSSHSLAPTPVGHLHMKSGEAPVSSRNRELLGIPLHWPLGASQPPIRSLFAHWDHFCPPGAQVTFKDFSRPPSVLHLPVSSLPLGNPLSSLYLQEALLLSPGTTIHSG